MQESNKLDLETIMDDLSDRIEEMIEDALVDQIDNAVTSAIHVVLPEAFNESCSDFEFALTNGTIVRPKQHMKLLSPDKSKLLLCYGGLRVDGSTLMVQTRISCWESIAYYKNREEAIEALIKVKNAMDSNLFIFEL